MDVFKLRNDLIDDYASYIRSFLKIRDSRIREKVDSELNAGLLWPDPLVQLNPNYEPGGSVDELVEEGLLSPLCAKIFRRKANREDFGLPLLLHRHQREAIEIARRRQNYILTTGTGSGKSLSYIIPIVDYVLRHPEEKGSVKAIIVYPMNALANSQLNELEKFLEYGMGGQRPVTYRRYTGQESAEDRSDISKNPPDILLTNYVMLELMLTRRKNDKQLIEAAQGLKFLVLDELHTYRGRQGADIGMLVRRTREILHAEAMQCIGTSATMASDESGVSQKQQVADVARTIFGAEFLPENIIGETLRRVTVPHDFKDPAALDALRAAILKNSPAEDFQTFTADPLSTWIEDTIGLRMKNGTAVRADARPLRGGNGCAKELSALTGVPEKNCEAALMNYLSSGYTLENPENGRKAFVFRLHQFISRGDTVYASPEKQSERYLTTSGQRYVPGSNQQKVLLPLAFCRECGEPFYIVQKDPEKGREAYFIPKKLDEGSGGFLYYDEEDTWDDDPSVLMERLPEEWLNENGSVKSSFKKYLPRRVRVSPAGEEGETGIEMFYLPSPFHFCPHCGAFYSRPRTNYPALATLSAGGRSTDTSLLSYSLLTRLKDDPDLPDNARKLLSFTDNRQDASLQAGHFNDFMATAVLRIAIYNAVRAHPEGITDPDIAQAVFTAMGIDFKDFALKPESRFQARTDAINAFKALLRYRLYADLRRGWRLTSPNLEQCGLLRVSYRDLKEIAADESLWEERHPALAAAAPDVREELMKVLLDSMRRELAIAADCLTDSGQQSMALQTQNNLNEDYVVEDWKVLRRSICFYAGSRPSERNVRDNGKYLGPRSDYANYLNRRLDNLLPDERTAVIRDLFAVMTLCGVTNEKSGGKQSGFQINAGTLLWEAADGTQPFYDPLRRHAGKEQGSVNRFFVNFYQKTDIQKLLRLKAREHTAQVPAAERETREQRFRSAELPLLFCSPTMEVGVDISQLNVVNMRNVPPTPANYAQRSGRAGRSGQPALVFTYCTIGSPHDQYYFKRQQQMVSGHVAPPRMDLANEDMLRSHVQALWLYCSGADLGRNMNDVICWKQEPELPVFEHLTDALRDPRYREDTIRMARHIFETMGDALKNAPWWSDTWLEESCAQLERNFENACQRWRTLYLTARQQQKIQQGISLDVSRSKEDRKRAEELSAQALKQQTLLTADSGGLQSDFYPYRYFAGEGFLPGYSFPRLPVSAYIPGRRDKDDEGASFLQRPRFLAVSEFGPNAIIYHEGLRYQIHRVNLPGQPGEGEGALLSCKICPQCGYIHPLNEDAPRDTCENCGAPLAEPKGGLFRMTSVVTKRKDHITSDEEERMRLSYQLQTGYRWTEDIHGMRLVKSAEISRDGVKLAEIIYGQNAALWRMNLGWRSRGEDAGEGFLLDMERGTWVHRDSDPDVEENDSGNEAYSARISRVIPFVEDHKNSLLFRPAAVLSEEECVTLAAALRRAIQQSYQLEDSELAAELLPNGQNSRQILLYESAEGGAGVLRRLAEEKNAFAEVCRKALELCHFDPETGADRQHAPGAHERCEAACYDCLMSYGNQHDHQKLDRFLIRELLLDLAGADVSLSAGAKPREEHYRELKKLCESSLETKWLDWMNSHELPLPEEGQYLIADPMTRADFFYSGKNALIYIDGPVHDEPRQAEADRELRETLEDSGYLVIVFRYDADWAELIAAFPSVFGKMEE